MPATTKAPPKPSRAALSAEAAERNLARIRAEGHLEALLARAQESEREAAAMRRAGFDPDTAPTPAQRAQHPSGPPPRYYPMPTAEAIAAAQAEAEEAARAYEEADRREQEAPADLPGPEGCRRTGSRFYAGSRLELAGAVYHPGEPVPNDALASFDGRKIAAMLKARLLRDGHPFAALELKP